MIWGMSDTVVDILLIFAVVAFVLVFYFNKIINEEMMIKEIEKQFNRDFEKWDANEYNSLKESSEKLVAFLESIDPTARSRLTQENATNWMLGISTITLLWLIEQMDKFVILSNGNQFLPHKILFSLSLILLAASTSLFLYSRIKLYDIQLKIDESLDFLKNIPDIRDRIREEDLSRKEIIGAEKLDDKKLKEYEGKIIENTVNDIFSSVIFKIYRNEAYGANMSFQLGYVAYPLGLIFAGIYLLIFIFKMMSN